jgi:hypothetical protein
MILTALKRYDIDLSSFVIESDQGSALKSFALNHQITQRFSLHHFLRVLLGATFSWGITNMSLPKN